MIALHGVLKMPRTQEDKTLYTEGSCSSKKSVVLACC